MTQPRQLPWDFSGVDACRHASLNLENFLARRNAWVEDNFAFMVPSQFQR